MTRISDLYGRMIDAMGVEDLTIPTAGVKFYKQGDDIPAGVRGYEPQGLTLTSCQSTRQAGFGDSVLLTPKSIGCVAAAITFGLVDKDQDQAMGESLVVYRYHEGPGQGPGALLSSDAEGLQRRYSLCLRGGRQGGLRAVRVRRYRPVRQYRNRAERDERHDRDSTGHDPGRLSVRHRLRR